MRGPEKSSRDQIGKHIQRTTNDFLQMQHGSLYPALHRLEERGLVTSKWEMAPRADSAHVDGWVLTFAAGLVLATGLMAGLVPAISSTGKELLSALRESSRSASVQPSNSDHAAVRCILVREA